MQEQQDRAHSREHVRAQKHPSSRGFCSLQAPATGDQASHSGCLCSSNQVKLCRLSGVWCLALAGAVYTSHSASPLPRLCLQIGSVSFDREGVANHATQLANNIQGNLKRSLEALGVVSGCLMQQAFQAGSGPSTVLRSRAQ